MRWRAGDRWGVEWVMRVVWRMGDGWGGGAGGMLLPASGFVFATTKSNLSLYNALGKAECQCPRLAPE